MFRKQKVLQFSLKDRKLQNVAVAKFLRNCKKFSKVAKRNFPYSCPKYLACCALDYQGEPRQYPGCALLCAY